MGGGTSSYREMEETDVVLLWGSNARETHPIFFHHLLKGVHRGARLITVDPRRTSSAEWADLWLGLDVGSDIALANAMAREIIAAGLEHREFSGRARVRQGRPGDDLLDPRHHRAPQRGRQRPRAHLARAPHRARRAVGVRAQPAAWPEQRAGRRRHGRAPGPAAGLPAR